MSEPTGSIEIVDVEVDEVLAPAVPSGRTWRIGGSGVGVVAGLELRQRVRSPKWLVVLGLWFALTGGLTLLIRWSTHEAGDSFSDESSVGRTTFGIIVFLVLSLGGLVAPALSATSINGDRQAGVLAIMQTTLLSPAEIVVGKLLAAWSTALALLAVASPFVLWALADKGVRPGDVATTLVLTALTLLVVCAIGLGWSALTARTSTSAVLTYLTVAGLGVGLPLMFAITLPAVTTTETVRVRVWASDGGDDGRCEWTTQRLDRSHTERTWWLLAASPYVVVADATPTPDRGSRDDPLSAIRRGVRETRLGPASQESWCGGDDGQDGLIETSRAAEAESLSPAWPWGLGVDLGVGALFVVAAVRRLRTPIRRLPSGTRVA